MSAKRTLELTRSDSQPVPARAPHALPGDHVERNPGMKRSALETVDLLRDAAAKGQAKGRAPLPEREPPERERSLTKPFEIGI